MSGLRVAIVMGGPSAEAEVSRVSAAGVRDALGRSGHEVWLVELDAQTPAALAGDAPDVVFPVVHGALGEDGCLQGLLEVMALPYVGSGVAASALAADKLLAKALFRAAGLPVATEATVARGEDLARAASRVRSALGPAVVIKPHAQGSAIGVTRVGAEAGDDAVARALSIALAIDEVALCERFVRGREVTCGVLDAAALGLTRALPPTAIEARLGDFYDFRSRYAAGGSVHHCPADLPSDVAARVQAVALGAHHALGCRDLSRADFIVGDGEDAGAVTLLEVNTIPGMTPTSLFPEAAAVAGVAMDRLVDGLVRSALARGPRRRVSAVPMP